MMLQANPNYKNSFFTNGSLDLLFFFFFDVIRVFWRNIFLITPSYKKFVCGAIAFWTSYGTMISTGRQSKLGLWKGNQLEVASHGWLLGKHVWSRGHYVCVAAGLVNRWARTVFEWFKPVGDDRSVCLNIELFQPQVKIEAIGVSMLPTDLKVLHSVYVLFAFNHESVWNQFSDNTRERTTNDLLGHSSGQHG